MTARLQSEIKQSKPFRNVETEVFLNLVRTADALARDLEQTLKPYGLTATQYNVLRILRGAGRAGMTCSEISQRMVTSDPDVTRLLDRMEKRGLIHRCRGKNDRRVVTANITLEGAELAQQLDFPLDELHQRQFKGWKKQELTDLVTQLENIREGVTGS
jgi:DNA-binding MarR family transcriptional regulator